MKMSHNETAEEKYSAKKIMYTSLSLGNILHVAEWAKLFLPSIWGS